MARQRRDALPPPPNEGGGYEFEIVKPGPPTYFTTPPEVKARGGLTPLGDGEGLVPRPAPPLTHRANAMAKRMKLRLFTARFRDPKTYGIKKVTVRGHELRYTHREPQETGSGENHSIVEVLVHLPTGTISVAVFQLHDLLGLFESHSADTAM